MISTIFNSRTFDHPGSLRLIALAITTLLALTAPLSLLAEPIDKPSLKLKSDTTEINRNELIVKSRASEGDNEAASAHTEEIQRIGRQLGIFQFEKISNQLIEAAQASQLEGNSRAVEILADSAYTLSPNSAPVNLSLLGLALRSSSYSKFFERLPTFFESAWENPFSMSLLLVDSIYVALLVLSGATLLLWSTIFAGVFCTSSGAIVRWQLSILIFIVLAVCFLLGPIWGLLFLSLTFLRRVAEARWLAVCTGIVISTWAAVVPLREGARLILADATMPLAKLALSFPPDLSSINVNYRSLCSEASQNRSWPKTYLGTLNLLCSSVLRRAGALEEAQVNFVIARALLDNHRALQREIALIHISKGNLADAQSTYSDLIATGDQDPGTLINYSKVLFKLGRESESQKLIEQAGKLDSTLAALNQELESSLGALNPRALIEPTPPLALIIRSAFNPPKLLEVASRTDLVLASLIQGVPYRVFILLGPLLIIIALLFPAISGKTHPPSIIQAGVVPPLLWALLSILLLIAMLLLRMNLLLLAFFTLITLFSLSRYLSGKLRLPKLSSPAESAALGQFRLVFTLTAFLLIASSGSSIIQLFFGL